MTLGLLLVQLCSLLTAARTALVGESATRIFVTQKPHEAFVKAKGSSLHAVFETLLHKKMKNEVALDKAKFDIYEASLQKKNRAVASLHFARKRL